MRCWSLSIIANSPLMHPAHAYELTHAYRDPCLSYGAMLACNDVAERTKARETPLAIVYSVDVPMGRVYLEYPAFEDWFALERGCFVSEGDMFVFTVAGLH